METKNKVSYMRFNFELIDKDNREQCISLYTSPKLISILSDMPAFVYPNPREIDPNLSGYIFDIAVYNSKCDDNRIIISPNRYMIRDSKINAILDISEEKDYEYILEIDSNLIF